jgi:signal transduction histidine kinase
MVIRDISERVRVQDELRHSQERLRALAARIEDVREQERSGVARELHDELGQVLTAMKMDLRWLGRRLDPGQVELRERTSSMIGLVDQAIQSVQRLASRLRPGLLDDLGLAAAVEWLGADFRRHSGIRCDVSVDVTESRIGPKSTTALFRIIQEALTNVVRHASASRVTVRLREMGSDLEAMVADDGTGISGADAADARSFGLLGMSERAHGMGGRLSIHGEPGKGTIILVTVPLPAEGALP